MVYKLSPTALNILEDCPRCFWLHTFKGIRRPGVFSSLPMKMDSIIKKYFNKYRELGSLPPIIKEQIIGKLAISMPKTLKHVEDNGLILSGRPDEYFELDNGCIVAFDHKTKSKAPTGVHSAYQLQLNVYSYLLEVMGYKTTNIGYLAFYYPDDCDLHYGMSFNCRILEVKTYPSFVKDLIKKALDVLTSDMPDSDENCKYCKWNKEINSECR